MKQFKELREDQITKSKFYKDRDRKGHEGRLYAVGVKWTDVEKAIIQSLKANKGTKAHMSSFDGLSSNPKEVEVMGDMKALVSIADKIGKKGKVKVDKNPWESVEEGKAMNFRALVTKYKRLAQQYVKKGEVPDQYLPRGKEQQFGQDMVDYLTSNMAGSDQVKTDDADEMDDAMDKLVGQIAKGRQ